MNETLTCTVCSKEWKRERVRGRKPLLCPKCARAQDLPLPKSVPTSLTAPLVQSDIKNDSIASSDFTLTPGKVYTALHPKPSNYKDLLQQTRNGSTWKCPNCNHVLKLEIPVSDIPTHRCTPNMVSVKLYERIK
jgi:predicted RNA-binding Zn-ribbon protein involved in translation (DUF1610 family)